MMKRIWMILLLCFVFFTACQSEEKGSDDINELSQLATSEVKEEKKPMELSSQDALFTFAYEAICRNGTFANSLFDTFIIADIDNDDENEFFFYQYNLENGDKSQISSYDFNGLDTYKQMFFQPFQCEIPTENQMYYQDAYYQVVGYRDVNTGLKNYYFVEGTKWVELYTLGFSMRIYHLLPNGLELIAEREEFPHKPERNLYRFYENGSMYELSGAGEYERQLCSYFSNQEEIRVNRFTMENIFADYEEYDSFMNEILATPIEKEEWETCFLTRELDSVERTKDVTSGNWYNETTVSNLKNGGYIAGNDLWLFYQGKDGIYRRPTFSLYGKEEKINHMSHAHSFYIYDDWLYFNVNDELYRCRFDGSEMGNYQCSVIHPQYQGDMVYFRIGSAIYKMNLEQRENFRIFEFSTFGQFQYVPEEEAIYFLYPSGEAFHGYVCKYYLGSSEVVTIYDNIVSRLYYQDGFFYFFDSSDGHIYKANRDFSEVRQIVNLYAYSYHVYRDGIIASDGFEKLYKMDLEGNNKVLLADNLAIVPDSINVVGDKVYFKMYDGTTTHIYRVDMNGDKILEWFCSQ